MKHSFFHDYIVKQKRLNAARTYNLLDCACLLA